MTRPLGVLIVDDSEDDAALLARELRRSGYEVSYERVDTAIEMQDALARRAWDLVLSDYAMPQFCALKALQVLQKSGLDLPFIIVSGAISEAQAVEFMRAGAHDYVMKDRLARLTPAIERELRDAEVRKERRKAEENLRHAERLASLGTFAAGIAHEINNPLAALLITARQGLKATDDPALIRSLLSEIAEDGERCAQIVASVLRFARRNSSAKAPIPLRQVLRTACTLAKKHARGRDVNVELRLADRLPNVHANTVELEQVFVNLITNAMQASQPQQTVVVDAEVTESHVRVQVQDRGYGMDAEARKHAFDPFFTTRADSGGTGLGLSMAHGIVAEHGGTIALESRPGRGTRITVELPHCGFVPVGPSGELG